MSGGYLTTAALDWLSIVLSERYGHPFSLEGHRDCFRLFITGSDRVISVQANASAFSRTDSDLPFTTWDAEAEGWVAPITACLPAPGSKSLPAPLISPSPDGYHIAYDVIGLTYWMLARLEEVNRTDLDSHDRFPATASHAYQYGYLERPVVDEWLHILGQVIQRVWPSLVLKKHQFSIKVSHDVDVPSRYGFRPIGPLMRAIAGDILKRRSFKALWMAPLIRLNTVHQLHPADPFNTFEWLMDVSDANGLVSAFYFICGRTDPTKDADYEPEHPAIRSLMRRIHERGHEIGLHPSYGSYRAPHIIAEEARRLRNVAQEEGIYQTEWGGRMHYLRWQHPVTLNAWEAAGMSYDSTLGYADLPGFRCGTCFDYPAFDPLSHRILALRVRPLIIMECTIIASRYMGLGSGKEAEKKILELKKYCALMGGCFSLLWHNSQFTEVNERALYCAALTGEIDSSDPGDLF